MGLLGMGEVNACLGVPPRKASGSGFPLLLLGRITSLWGIRSNPSRGVPVRPIHPVSCR